MNFFEGDGITTCTEGIGILMMEMYGTMEGTVRVPVIGTLNRAISNFQTWFVRTVMEVLKYYWM